MKCARFTFAALTLLAGFSLPLLGQTSQPATTQPLPTPSFVDELNQMPKSYWITTGGPDSTFANRDQWVTDHFKNNMGPHTFTGTVVYNTLQKSPRMLSNIMLKCGPFNICGVPLYIGVHYSSLTIPDQLLKPGDITTLTGDMDRFDLIGIPESNIRMAPGITVGLNHSLTLRDPPATAPNLTIRASKHKAP